jgi:hypothetical protein
MGPDSVLSNTAQFGGAAWSTMNYISSHLRSPYRYCNGTPGCRLAIPGELNYVEFDLTCIRLGGSCMTGTHGD